MAALYVECTYLIFMIDIVNLIKCPRHDLMTENRGCGFHLLCFCPKNKIKCTEIHRLVPNSATKWESRRSMSTLQVRQNWKVYQCPLASGPDKICKIIQLAILERKSFSGRFNYRSAPKPPSVILMSSAVVHLYPCVQLHLSCFWNERLPRHNRSGCTEQFDLQMSLEFYYFNPASRISSEYTHI